MRPANCPRFAPARAFRTAGLFGFGASSGPVVLRPRARSTSRPARQRREARRNLSKPVSGVGCARSRPLVRLVCQLERHRRPLRPRPRPSPRHRSAPAARSASKSHRPNCSRLACHDAEPRRVRKRGGRLLRLLGLGDRAQPAGRQWRAARGATGLCSAASGSMVSSDIALRDKPPLMSASGAFHMTGRLPVWALFILYRVEQAGHSMMVDTDHSFNHAETAYGRARGNYVPSSPKSIDTGESVPHKDRHLRLLIVSSSSMRELP